MTTKPVKNPTWEDVKLLDDGTLDTVVSVFGNVIRYSDTSDYRTEDGSFSDKGWQEFAETVIQDYLNDAVPWEAD